MAAEIKRAVRPQPQQMVKCPRCNSTETKFCYYNNYSTTQPRYFCKNCKRYWTDGGTLRNVPVGGGLRKNKRSKTKLNPMAPPSPLPTASLHHPKPSSLMLSDNFSGINLTLCGHADLPTSNPDINLGLLHTPNYLLFDPRNYEMNLKPGPITSQPPLYQPEVNFSQQIAAPLLAGGIKNDATLSGGYLPAYPWHQREQESGLSENMQLQPGGYLPRNENSSVNYNLNTFFNVSDWQQVSEGLFGAAGDDNYAPMQAPQPPQTTNFDTSTKL